MKRLFFILNILLLAILSACKKDSSEPILGLTPEERMNKSLTEYRETLQGNTAGWKAFLFPQGGGGYGFYVNFKPNDRLDMLADLDGSTAGDLFESTYRLKAVMAPSLIFDTYNYLHLLADPDDGVFGGSTGVGYASDIEFEMQGISGDTVKMLGKKRGSEMLLVKISAADQKRYLDGDYLKAIDAMSNYISANSNLFIQTAATEQRVQVAINVATKEASLIWLEGAEVKTVTVPFVFTLDGLFLRHSLDYKGTLISGLTWDATTKSFSAQRPSGVAIPVQASAAPILPLHVLLGINYAAVVVPQTLGSVGYSPSFVSMHNTLRTVLNTGTYFLLRPIYFSFDAARKRMSMYADMPQTNGGATYRHTFNFTYEKDADGNFSFTYSGYADFGSYTAARFMPLINKITTGKIKADYLVNGSTIMGQFTSLDDPAFFFSGVLR